MADFVAVLKKTIAGLPENTPAMRGKVYEKARSTVAAKLSAINPPPPPAVADRQKQALEEAIKDVEASYFGPGEDPFAELENVFADPAKKQAAAPTQAPEPVQAKATSSPAASVLPGSHTDPKPWPGRDQKPETEPVATFSEQPGAPFEDEEETAEDDGMAYEEPRRRRNFAPLIAAAAVLALILGGGYAVWLNKDDFLAMLNIGGSEDVATAPAVGDTAPVPPPATATKSAVNTGAEEGAQKFTQRLNSDGTEVDQGPAGGVASIGEGTSVAAATQPSTALPADTSTDTPPADPDVAASDTGTPAAAATDPAAVATDPAAPPAAGDAAPPVAPAVPPATTPDTATATASDAQVAVGQKAIYYEERTNVAEGSAEPGSILWSLVQESPGNDLPAEPAIRAEATIPGKDLQLRMTIKRNIDKTIPASHTIELIFITPENFDGGGIENILRFAMKDTEEDPGNALLAIPVKITDGYFLVALNDTKAEIETNLGLLRRQQWIDVPLVYKSGRRALFTMEKGVPGDKVFDEAIKAWQGAAASAG